MPKIDISQFTSKTAICGYVVVAALPVALSAGDHLTQFIAGGIAAVALVALGVFAPDADRTISTAQIAKIGQNDPDAPLTARTLVEMDPSSAVKRDVPPETK